MVKKMIDPVYERHAVILCMYFDVACRFKISMHIAYTFKIIMHIAYTFKIIACRFKIVDLNNYLVIACRFKISRPK